MKKHPLADCEKCPLQFAKWAPTVGPNNATVAVVSRSPAKGDCIKKQPFSGPSGKVLDHLLDQNGYARENIKITNVVLCRADDVPSEAIRCCSKRLEADLENVSTIIAAGREAAISLAGAANITSARGIVHSRNHKRVIVTNNPAIVLRDSRGFADLVRDFKLALNPVPAPKLPEVHWTNDADKAGRWFREFNRHVDKSKPYSCDIESRGLTPDAPIVAFGLSFDGLKAISVGELVTRENWFMRDYLWPFLADHSRRKYLWHNGKFDCKVLRYMGIPARIDADTILLSYALDERPGVHALEYLCRTELGWPDYEPEIVKYFKKHSDEKNPDGTWKIPVPDELYPYNALDCAGVAQLFPILRDRAERDRVLFEPYFSMLLPSSEALIHLESSGIAYNIEEACDILEEEVWPELLKIRASMKEMLNDPDYNPASSQQNAKWVYDVWRCMHKMQERKDKARSVDEAAYNELIAGRFISRDMSGMGLSDEHPQTLLIREWAKNLKRFKQLDKQRSNYLEGLVVVAEKRPDERPGIGRIFGNFNNINTVTGRLGSDKPNMQNITRPKDGLPNIRRLIVASRGRKLISADYSQAELRTLAVIAGDINLLEAYGKGLDLHAIAAERFYGANWTKENRSSAKNMNFGVAYDQSPETFQEKHGIPTAEAREFVAWWWKEHPQVKTWRDSIHKTVKADGEVVTLFGRKRRFPLLTKENYNDSMREAVNFVIQSTAHDFTLWSLIQLTRDYDPSIIRYIIEGHDSIVADCSDLRCSDFGLGIKTVMESAPKETLGWTLPFTVEVSVGDNWSDMEEIEV